MTCEQAENANAKKGNEARHDWRRRCIRPWRWLFIAYTISLTTGTHWPQLHLGTPALPVPDKLAHMIAFGGLAFLFLQARWIKTGWLAGLVVLAWAGVDEASQALPGLYRTISVQDLFAGQLGVVVVVAWWWALLPLGGAANRQRLRWQRFVLDDLLRRPVNWLIAGGIGAVSAIAVGGVVWVLVRFVFDRVLEDPLSTLLTAALIGAFASLQVTLAAMARGHAQRLAKRMPCPECSGSCTSAPIDERGEGVCPTCGSPIVRGLWRVPMDLPWRAVMRGAIPAAIATATVLALGIGVFVFLLVMARHATPFHQLIAVWHGLDSDLRLVVDLAGIGLSIAVGVRLYRMRQATIYDHQADRCRGCGHDVSHAPLETGCGRCPECGLDFATYGAGGRDG